MVSFKYLLLPLYVYSKSTTPIQRIKAEDFQNVPDKTETFTQIYGVNCGLTPAGKTISKIINGEKTTIKDNPWQVYLSEGTPPYSWLFCGGTLISPRWVVTAAHCKSGNQAYIFLKTATQDPYNKGSNAEKERFETRKITKWIIHQDYDPNAAEQFDLAVVKMDAEVIFDNFAQPACLPLHTFCLNGNKNANGEDKVMLTVSGFGTKENQEVGVDTSPSLRRASVPVLSFQGCQDKLYDENELYINYESEFCAGGLNKDSCTGDSGGPIVWKDGDGVTTLVGVVSWGIGCNLPDYPGVYVKLSRFIHWITQNTGVYVDDMIYDEGLGGCQFDHKSTAREAQPDTTNVPSSPGDTTWNPQPGENPKFDEDTFNSKFIKEPFPKSDVYAYKRCLKVPKKIEPNDVSTFTEKVQISMKKDRKCKRGFKKTNEGDDPDSLIHDRPVFEYDWKTMLIKTRFIHKDGDEREMCLGVHPYMDSVFYKLAKYNYPDSSYYDDSYKCVYWVHCDTADKSQYFVMEKDTEFIRPACLLDYCLSFDGHYKYEKANMRVTKSPKKCKKMSWSK